MALSPCLDGTAAEWIVRDKGPWTRVAGFGPGGFSAYARLRFLPDPGSPGDREADAPEHELTDLEEMARAADVLAPHTTSSNRYFGVWDGWGGAFDSPALPRFAIRNRVYYLLSGVPEDLWTFGTSGMATYWPWPAFVWPEDRAWCLAHDVDPHWAGIGASKEGIKALLADDLLDVVKADPRVPQPFYRG